jgi:hypothetical protein
VKISSGIVIAVISVTGVAYTSIASAFGSAGHRIAGRVAEAYLCEEAIAEVNRLGESDSLGELGQWADRIRSTPPWTESGPWHYLNIGDNAKLDAYQSPPEGDVLWAISHYRSELADDKRSRSQRGQALKFLVHFVVDLHQPLHVGRESDRGGTTISVSYDDKRISLHRFWDTEASTSRGQPIQYFIDLADSWASVVESEVQRDGARLWAAESFALRKTVYSFDSQTGWLEEGYVRRAGEITERRLVKAGLRLAYQLNSVFCP